MKLFLMYILVGAFLISGCAGQSTIGNGRIDPVEEATIRLAVGAAFTAMPAAAAPAYMVSSGLLALIGNGYASLPNNIDAVVKQEVDKLQFDQPTRSVFFDFVALVKAEVKRRLADAGISEQSRFVLIKQLIVLIHDVSRARVVPA